MKFKINSKVSRVIKVTKILFDKTQSKKLGTCKCKGFVAIVVLRTSTWLNGIFVA